MRKDTVGTVLWVDEAFTTLLGWSFEEIVNRRSLEFTHVDDHHRAIVDWMRLLDRPEEAEAVRCRFRHRDGSWVWFEVTNHNRLGDPEHGDVFAEMVDISAEMGDQQLWWGSDAMLQALTQALPLGVLYFGPDRQIRYRNERLGAILGQPRATTITEQLWNVMPTDRLSVENAVEGVLAGQDIELEVWLRRARRCHLRLRPLTDPLQGIVGALLCVTDITEDARLRDELQQRATYDALTRCLNRAAIIDALEESLAEVEGNATSADPHATEAPATPVSTPTPGTVQLPVEGTPALPGSLDVSAVSPPRGGSGTAVVFFDVDHFKAVNDRLGHGAGDQLLVTVARRLRDSARDQDLVGRLGGDEFLVVCQEVASPERALAIADRLAEALAEPMELAGERFEPRVSIGVAWTSTAIDADALVAAADHAMYRSKRERSGRPALAPLLSRTAPGQHSERV